MDSLTPSTKNPDQLTEKELDALNTLSSRIGFADFSELATSQAEAYEMRNAFMKAVRLSNEKKQP